MNTVPAALSWGVLGFTGIVLGLAIAYQFYHARQKREMFEAALTAGQADVAKALIATNGGTAVLRFLAVAIAVIILAPIVLLPFVALGGVVAALGDHARQGGGIQATRSGPETARDAASRQAVEKITGAPLGTIEVMIGGHKAYGCLTGNTWGNQSCGSKYHPQLRFSTETPGFLNVFYIPDLQEYYVFGRARVDPSGKVVENGTISVVEAMGPVK